MTPTMLRDLIPLEFAQRGEEGCDVDSLQALWQRLRDAEPAEVESQLEALWTLLQGLPCPGEEREPSDLQGIRVARPDGPRALDPGLNDDALRDRLHGALLGRIAGCQLGKPVEGWHKSAIDAYLAAAGEDEIVDYLPFLESPPSDLKQTITMKGATRGHLHGALRDDDQDYTLLGLLLLEKHGAEVSASHVAQAWLELLPYHKTYTAERAAYRNLVDGLVPPATATFRNPYREWIGAQIRCDGWAYACPGRLEQAADFAFRDASVSHVKNGVYGEMYFAAVIAAAFCTTDIREAIELGLGEIPAECRLAECVQSLLAWREEEPDWRACWERIDAEYGRYHWVHTLNNAALVLLGLLYGDGDLGRTIGIAVHGGWDTDCNGATAGSVLGAMLGAAALPEAWVAPLDDRMDSALFGHAHNRISDLADRALALAKSLRG